MKRKTKVFVVTKDMSNLSSAIKIIERKVGRFFFKQAGEEFYVKALLVSFDSFLQAFVTLLNKGPVVFLILSDEDYNELNDIRVMEGDFFWCDLRGINPITDELVILPRSKLEEGSSR